MSTFRTAPQPEGYNCADPDFSRPLPGQVVSWPDHPNDPEFKNRPRTCPLPVGFLADPFMRKQLRPCVDHPWVGPPITVCQPPTEIF